MWEEALGNPTFVFALCMIALIGVLTLVYETRFHLRQSRQERLMLEVAKNRAFHLLNHTHNPDDRLGISWLRIVGVPLPASGPTPPGAFGWRFAWRFWPSAARRWAARACPWSG